MKKMLCTVLATCCVFLSACGASGAAEGCTITAYKDGEAVTVSEENADKLVALAEKSLDENDMIKLALTLDQADDGVYVLIEFPEERKLDDGSEYPIKTDCLEIITGTSEGALIFTCGGGRVYRVGSNSGSFAEKVKSYLE